MLSLSLALIPLAVLFLIPVIALVIAISEAVIHAVAKPLARNILIFWEAAESSSALPNYGDTETNQHMQMRATIVLEGLLLQGKSLLIKDQEKQQSFSCEG